jgi:hypothetical protein
MKEAYGSCFGSNMKLYCYHHTKHGILFYGISHWVISELLNQEIRLDRLVPGQWLGLIHPPSTGVFLVAFLRELHIIEVNVGIIFTCVSMGLTYSLG